MPGFSHNQLMGRGHPRWSTVALRGWSDGGTGKRQQARGACRHLASSQTAPACHHATRRRDDRELRGPASITWLHNSECCRGARAEPAVGDFRLTALACSLERFAGRSQPGLIEAGRPRAHAFVFLVWVSLHFSIACAASRRTQFACQARSWRARASHAPLFSAPFSLASLTQLSSILKFAASHHFLVLCSVGPT